MSRITSIFDRDVDPVTSPLVGFKVIGPGTRPDIPERKEFTMEDIDGRLHTIEQQIGMIGDILLANTGFEEEQEEFMAGSLFSAREPRS